MNIIVTTKDVRRVYEAATGREAVQMFFDDLRSSKIKLKDVGILGSWLTGEDKEGIPFRIAPSAWRCGLITQDQAISSFEAAELFFTSDEITNMAESDAWMIREDDSILDAEELEL